MNLIPIAYAANESMNELISGVNTVYKYSISIGGILAFGIILFAGIEYIVSAGNSGRQADAKDRIFKAILGLIILLSATFILQAFPGLLTSGFENPPSKKTEINAPVSDVSSNKRAEITTNIQEMIKNSDGTITGYKKIFDEIRAQYKIKGGYDAEFNVAVGSFFYELNQKNMDLEFYNSLSTISEKSENIRLHYFGKADIVQIANSMKVSDIPAIYDALRVSEDQRYLLKYIGSYDKIYDLWKIAETSAFPTPRIKLLNQIDDLSVARIFRLSTAFEQSEILKLLQTGSNRPGHSALYAELVSKFGK